MSQSLHLPGKNEQIKPTVLAFGILVVYTISSMYLERVVGISDTLLKTVFAFLYFLLWTMPLLYFWWKGKIREGLAVPILVLCVAVLYISPLTTIPITVGRNLPDIDFHAAKVLYSSTGHFFNDPITSYPSIYPPVYHIILGWIVRLSGASDSWSVLGIFHVLMLITLFVSVYLLANSLFNPRIGLLSVLFFCAVFDMPDQGLMFFPAPFLLGLTVMVNSVTSVYGGLKGKRWCFYLTGLGTGLAVTIWPAFLLLAIVLLAVILFTPDKTLRRPGDLLKFIPAFLIFPIMVWVPQYILLSKSHLMGHSTIGQFKGIPGLFWLFDFVSRFILLGGVGWHWHGVTVLFGITYVILIGMAILGFRSLSKEELMKKRFLRLSFILMFIVLLIVHYVFSDSYSRRVQILFSIPVIILAAYHSVTQLGRKYKLGVTFLIIWVGVFTTGWNTYLAHDAVLRTKNEYEAWKKDATGALKFIQSNTDFGDYIFATKHTYRYVISGYLVRFNLLAHRSGAYFSLNPDLSEKMLKQYNTVLGSNDFDVIMRILNYYGIRYILINRGEQDQFPGIGLLTERCTTVYVSEFYKVLRCDVLSK